MFGPGDALFGTLANLAKLLPVLPLIGGGRTRVCTENLNPDVVVMKSAKDRV